MGQRHHADGFTLLELLVVIVIITVLIAILLPTLDAARFQARKVQCLANMRQWGIAAHTFGSEHKDRVPRGIDWYGPDCGSSSCAGNQSTEISKYWFTRHKGSKHARGVNYKLAYAGSTTWRLSETGVLPAFGYLSDPQVLYCPDQDRSSQGQDWQLDNEVGARWWRELASERDVANPWSDSGSAAGYAHFLNGLAGTDQLPEELLDAGVSPNSRIERHWRAPTFTWVTENWQGQSAVNRDVAPLMYACARGPVPHRRPGAYPATQGQAGANGVMIDGSARWIAYEEMEELLRQFDPALSMPMKALGGSRFSNLESNWEVASSSIWGGDKVRFHVLARRFLQLAP